MKMIQKFRSWVSFLPIGFVIGVSAPSFAQEDVSCFSHEQAAHRLAAAEKEGPSALAQAEQYIMEVCDKSFNDTLSAQKNLAFAQQSFQLKNPPKIVIKNTGSVFYEGIDSCGYHPQRREGTCAIEVKRRYGFGGPPATGPGSWEHMAFCVYGLPANPFGWTLQNVSAVHVHDEAFGSQPSWYYTITDQAETRLHTTPVNGRTYLAKSILSWGIRPRGCYHNPVWGNEAYYQIKLDP